MLTGYLILFFFVIDVLLFEKAIWASYKADFWAHVPEGYFSDLRDLNNLDRIMTELD